MKRLITPIALVGLLTSVCPHVSINMGQTSEAFITLSAPIGPFATMGSFMALKICCTEEALAAFCTFEWFFMNTFYINIILMFIRIVCFLVNVCLLVLLQIP